MNAVTPTDPVNASSNTAVGDYALWLNTSGASNTAIGAGALFKNTTGNYNTALGSSALYLFTLGGDTDTGSSNIAIGYSAGEFLQAGSNNIYIGYIGAGVAPPNESNAIRIGDYNSTGAVQTATYIQGISGATIASGTAVMVASNGQLGTITSSRRFKHEIADMGVESSLLMKLRPVAFYYKPELDATQTRQYGLVAEEVAKIAPQLVVFDKDGKPETVRYHFVNAMLLNEVQKQRRELDDQQRANEDQKKTIAEQQAEIQSLAARLAKLESLLTPQP